MADNVAITAGTGTSIASDDIGGVQYQRVKLSLGADGTAVDAVAGAGSVSTAVQRVTLASDDPAVVDLAAIEVLETAGNASLVSILAKIIAAPATEAKQDTLIAKDFATQTTLAALNTKVTACNTGAVVLAAGSAAVGKLSANSGVDIGDVDVTSISAGENHLGEVGGNTSVFGVTFSLDTSAYATGDVLADSQVMTSVMRKTDGTGVLNSIVLNDKDDQGIAMDVVILDANVSLGTENSAVSISDTDADSILAIIPVGSADWTDLGGCRVAMLRNLGIPIKSVSGASTLYVGLITRGAPTHTASGITGRFGFLRD